jgi:uncharacterized protein YjbI with pentapeptide repeats
MTDDAKQQFQPANENPWYCLATVYGELEEKGNENLAKQNRVAWNRWMAAALSEEQRAEFVRNGFDASELVPLSKKERTEFLKTFSKRTNDAPPNPRAQIDFSDVRFEQRVSFESFVFPAVVVFRKATFLGNVYFDATTFSSAADFNKTAFSRDACFSKAAFSGNADFSRAAFSGDAYFREAAFFDQAFFHEAEFFGDSDFMACEFKSHTSFAGAKFRSHAPDFRDARLREATEWHDAEWPPSPTNEEAAQDQVYAYERLKAEMERLKKHEDEQFFFAKELHARRTLLWFKSRDGNCAIRERAKSAFGVLLNWAYEVFGGYGLSIGSPLFWLVVLFAMGADIFAWAPVHKGVPLPYDVAESLSLTNLLPLLPYKVDNDIIHLSPFAKIIGDLQSFLGVILLFLLGLALRNRFRMK